MLTKENLGNKLPAYADIIYPVFDFTGGLNTKSTLLFINRGAPYSLRPNQLTKMENLVRTASGGLVTRPGRVKMNSTALSPSDGTNEVRDIVELRTSAGVDKILCHAGNTIYVWNTSTSTWGIGTTLTTANTRIHWAMFRDTLYGVDGSNTPVSYDGTTFSTVSQLSITSTVLVAFRGRLWAIDGRTLRYSAENSPTDWTTPNNAGTLPVPTTRGQGGTGMLPFWDRLLVTTNGQVFQLFGVTPSLFTLSAVNFRYGHEGSPYSLLAAGNDIYMVTKRGLISLSVAYAQSETGDVQTDYASAAIEPTWQDITPSNFTNIIGVDDTMRNCLLLLCNRTGTQNNEALVADYYHRDEQGKPTWAKYTNFNFSSIAEVRSLNNIPEILMGSYDGFVYRQTDAATDDGSTIPVLFQYVTDLEMPHALKTLRHMVLFVTAAAEVNFLLATAYDFGARVLQQTLTFPIGSGDPIGTAFTVGVSAIGGTTFNSRRVSIPGHGRFVSFLFSANNASRVTIGGFVLYAGLRRMIQ